MEISDFACVFRSLVETDEVVSALQAWGAGIEKALALESDYSPARPGEVKLWRRPRSDAAVAGGRSSSTGDGADPLRSAMTEEEQWEQPGVREGRLPPWLRRQDVVLEQVAL